MSACLLFLFLSTSVTGRLLRYPMTAEHRPGVSRDVTGSKQTVVQVIKQLVDGVGCEIKKRLEVPPIYEKSTSYFIGEGGHFNFTLLFADPEAVEIKIRDNALFVTAPLVMEDLVMDIDEVNILVDGKSDYEIALKMDFTKTIPITMMLIAYRWQDQCDRAIFDFKLDEFPYMLNFMNNINQSGLSTLVKEEMWRRIMVKVRRMIEMHTLYLMRRSFQGLGPSFGEDLCTVELCTEGHCKTLASNIP